MDYRKQVIDGFIEDNCPNAKLVSYRDQESQLKYYTAEELEGVTGDWFPLCAYRDEKSGELIYGGRSGIYHTYVIGETGIGKTTRFCIQSIKALSSLKERPSMLITDKSGEIYENTYDLFKKRNYKVRIINCDDPARSDTYNPLSFIADEIISKGEITYDANESIRKIADIIVPIENTNDPMWDLGSRAYAMGTIFDKAEELIKGNYPEESFNIYNIIRNHDWIKNAFNNKPVLKSLEYYRLKGNHDISVPKMECVVNAPPRTRESYYSAIESRYDTFGHPAMYALSSNSTVDLNEFINEPTVIFIQSSVGEIGDSLISLLINNLFKIVKKLGRSSKHKKLPRNIHCFLDEFANCNIASKNQFLEMLTTSRKYGMFWHMLLQNDKQFAVKYDENTANIIISNCTEIYMGSADYETRERFARSCGMRTVESLASRLNPDVITLESYPIMTAEKLNQVCNGKVYIKQSGHFLLESYYEAFYKCPEFKGCEDIMSLYPYNNFDYKSTFCTPDDIMAKLKGGSSYEGYDEEEEKEEEKFVNESFVTYEDTVVTDEEIDDKDNESQEPPHDTFCDEPIGRILEDLRIAIEKNRRKINLYKISQIKVMPIFLKKAIVGIYLGETDLSQYAKQGSWRENIIKFEIIENLLLQNDFTDKKDWDNAIKKDCKKIMSIKYLPESLKKAFEDAKDEVVNEFTIGNILEIKKIINGSTEN